MENKIVEKLKKKNKGSLLVGSLLVLTLLMGFGIAISSFVLMISKNTEKSYKRIATISIAEAGIEKTLWELSNDEDISCTSTCTLDNGDFETNVIDIDDSTKEISVTSYIPSKNNPLSTKTIKTIVTNTPEEEEMEFEYAAMAGSRGIRMYSSSRINGDVYSKGDIRGYWRSTIDGNAYSTGRITGSRFTVTGEEKSYSPLQDLPALDVEYWKGKANVNNDPYQGKYRINWGRHETMGPRKIDGDLTLNSLSSLTLTGPLHITGNLHMNWHSDLYLDQSFGSTSTVIIVDGKIHINALADVHDLNNKAFIMLVSTKDSHPSIDLKWLMDGGIYYATNGTIHLHAAAKAPVLIGEGLILNWGSEINYKDALSSVTFSNESEEEQDIWKIKSWQEVVD